jgi:DNA-binding NarL/FixJ family response regulator
MQHCPATLRPPLSARELEVLRHVAHGDSNKIAARELGIAADTVGNHLRVIYLKLGATCRTDAVVIAFRRHLLSL